MRRILLPAHALFSMFAAAACSTHSPVSEQSGPQGQPDGGRDAGSNVAIDAAVAAPVRLGATAPQVIRTATLEGGADREIAFDGSGAVVLGGSYRVRSGSSSTAPNAVRVTRVAADGGVVFTKTFEVGLGSFGGLVAAADGIYVTGSFSGHLQIDAQVADSVVNPSGANGIDAHGQPSLDVFLLKLTPSGSLAWLRAFGGVADQQCKKLLRAPDGSLVMVGVFTGRIQLDSYVLTSSGGSTQADMFVATFDATGQPLSARNGPLVGNITDVAIDSRANLVFGGFAGATIFVGGSETPLGDGWIAKQDPAGNWLWAISTGTDTTAPWVGPLAVDSQDNVVAGCSGDGSPTVFGQAIGKAAAVLAKIDPAGNVVFVRNFGNTRDDGVAGIAVGPSDAILLTGLFYAGIDFGAGMLTNLLPPPHFDPDIFIAELDSNGAHRWSLSAGGEGIDIGQRIAVSGRTIAATGYFENAIDFGTGRIEGSGSQYLVWLGDR
jgi:hypothetical protein